MAPSLKQREGYEIIGSWYVNLNVPQDARDLLRKNIESMLEGSFSEYSVFNLAVAIHKGRSNDSFLKWAPEYTTGKTYTPDEILDIAEKEIKSRWEQILPPNKSYSSIFHHYLVGSTPPLLIIPPDPFVKIDVNFRRTPQDEYDDLSERVKINFYKSIDTNGDFKTARVIPRLGYRELWKDFITNGRYPSGAVVPATLVINYSSREARIEPGV